MRGRLLIASFGIVIAGTLFGCSDSGAHSTTATDPTKTGATLTTTTTSSTTTTVATTTTTAPAEPATTSPSIPMGDSPPETEPPAPEHSPLSAPPPATILTCTPGEQKMQDVPGYGYVLTVCDAGGHLWNVVGPPLN